MSVKQPKVVQMAQTMNLKKEEVEEGSILPGWDHRWITVFYIVSLNESFLHVWISALHLGLKDVTGTVYGCHVIHHPVSLIICHVVLPKSFREGIMKKLGRKLFFP